MTAEKFREFLVNYCSENIGYAGLFSLIIRIGLAIFYLMIARLEEDVFRIIYSQRDLVCIQFFENSQIMEEILVYGSITMISDYFMGALGLLPLYRLYNDPFCIGYNIFMSAILFRIGIYVKTNIQDCGLPNLQIIIDASDVLMVLGGLHLIPCLATFVLLRKGEHIIWLNRWLRCFMVPPKEGFWWTLPGKSYWFTPPSDDVIKVNMLGKTQKSQ
uniref:Uncharacterized protein n=1 Tax=Glossina brevipalpis TaxID=37001 RepID=A0A1A9W326_9MUSC